MLHELAVTNNWGLKRSPQAQREEAQLKYLQAVKLKQEKARQREIARKQQEAQANLGWGTVEKVRRTSDGKPSVMVTAWLIVLPSLPFAVLFIVRHEGGPLSCLMGFCDACLQQCAVLHMLNLSQPP